MNANEKRCLANEIIVELFNAGQFQQLSILYAACSAAMRHKCQMCDGHGMVGGWTSQNPDGASQEGDTCPHCEGTGKSEEAIKVPAQDEASIAKLREEWKRKASDAYDASIGALDIKPLTGIWMTRCCVCGKEYLNGVGSTPCCGSIQQIVPIGPDTQDMLVSYFENCEEWVKKDEQSAARIKKLEDDLSASQERYSSEWAVAIERDKVIAALKETTEELATYIGAAGYQGRVSKLEAVLGNACAVLKEIAQ